MLGPLPPNPKAPIDLTPPPPLPSTLLAGTEEQLENPVLGHLLRGCPLLTLPPSPSHSPHETEEQLENPVLGPLLRGLLQRVGSGELNPAESVFPLTRLPGAGERGGRLRGSGWGLAGSRGFRSGWVESVGLPSDKQARKLVPPLPSPAVLGIPTPIPIPNLTRLYFKFGVPVDTASLQLDLEDEAQCQQLYDGIRATVNQVGEGGGGKRASAQCQQLYDGIFPVRVPPDASGPSLSPLPPHSFPLRPCCPRTWRSCWHCARETATVTSGPA